MQFIILIAMLGVMWFVLIVPQQRRVKAHKALVASLEEGDEVLTAGGIHGVINEVETDTVILEIAEGVEIRVAKGAINERFTVAQSTESAEGE